MQFIVVVTIAKLKMQPSLAPAQIEPGSKEVKLGSHSRSSLQGAALAMANPNSNSNYKHVDLFSIKAAYQGMIIQKTMDAHEFLANFLKLSNPLTKMTLAFILLNPFQTWSLVKTNSVYLYSFGMFMKRSITAFVYRKPQPVKKTFEIFGCSIET